MEETTIIEEKPYTLKKLSSRDVFVFSSILKQIGYSELKECLQSVEVKKMIAKMSSTSTAKVEELGLNIMMDISTVVITHLASAEDSIYQLLSNLSGMSKMEISKLDAEIFMQMIVDVFKQDGFKNFFKVVSGLFK